MREEAIVSTFEVDGVLLKATLTMMTKEEMEAARMMTDAEFERELEARLDKINAEAPDEMPKHFEAKIQLPPGSLMLRFAETVVSKKKFERDCMAALADWHEEYFEALDQKRGIAKMAAIRIRNTLAFIHATGLLVIWDMAGKLVAKLISKISGA